MQLPMQLVTEISSKWHNFCFNIYLFLRISGSGDSVSSRMALIKGGNDTLRDPRRCFCREVSTSSACLLSRWWPSSSSACARQWTNWSLDKMANNLQTSFWHAFSRMKIIVFWFKFYWSLFRTKDLIDISRHWFRQWLGLEQATCHYLI